jgi:non-canonical poly(A) RNA polymerase PAPD5/7
MNIDEMSENEEEQEGASKETEETSADTENGVHKVARTATARADGDSVPKWSNPEIYSALPPPEELRPGKKIDFVQLIRKAKNEAAEKGDANNAVAANDDFISFGDDDGSAKTTDLQSFEDDEPKTNKRPQDGGFVQGPMNDLDYVDDIVNNGAQNKRPYPAADLHDQPQHSKAKRKRGEIENVRGIVQEWMATARCDTAPWLDPRHNYAHLVNDPLKW